MNLEKIKNYQNILITGGAGAIGSNLVRRLIDLGIQKIFILDNLDSGKLENIPNSPQVIFINGDVTDDAVLYKIFENKIDIVFHLAANFANQNSIDHPEKDLLTNIFGTVKLLEYSKNYDIKKFLYYNTSCIYNKHKDFLLENDLNLDFETPYAISKYSGEQYGLFYNKYHKLPFLSLRIFNSYGPHEYPGKYRNVIPNFFWQAINNKPLTIFGDGRDTRNFTFVSDIVDATILLAIHPKSSGQIFNIGSKTSISILDLANKINKIVGSSAGLTFLEKRNWDNTKSRIASLSKVEEYIDYRAVISIDDGLLKYYNWFKEQNNESINY